MDEPKETRRLRPDASPELLERRLPRPGELFAQRYEIASELGRGGFGTVFAAQDTALGRPVAIKILSRGSHDPTTVARFLQEARAAAALPSEHVVSVHEIVVRPDDAPYLVMELLRGADLQDELADRGTIPVAEAVDLVLEAALGLAHAHARGIVHRDLKPRNLFWARREDGTRAVKVLDFGIARWASSDVTETGAAIGTPRYMAPEQLRSSRTVDARADIWSLGVVLYELTTGAPIFDAETALQFAAQIVAEPHVPLRVRAPTLPTRLATVVDRCLAKDPAQRFADLAALAEALAELAGTAHDVPARIAHVLRRPTAIDLDDTLARGTVAPSPPSISARRRWLGVVASLAAVAAIAVGVSRWRATRAPARPRSAATLPPPAPSPAPPRATIAASTPTVVAAPIAVVPPAVPRPAASPRAVAKPPTATEVAAITAWCLDHSRDAPAFLVPTHRGPAPYTCGGLALLGCAGLVRRCATAPTTTEERASCRAFVTGLRAAGACR